MEEIKDEAPSNEDQEVSYTCDAKKLEDIT